MKKNAETIKKTYRDSTHTAGRLLICVFALLIFLVPTLLCVRYDAWPDMITFLKGVASVVAIFWIVGSIEIFTYSPMLGSGGTYLTYMTGNSGNLKLPCAVNAMKSAGVSPGSDEGEVISTIAIAVSSIVTTLVIAVGVLLLVVTDVGVLLEAEALEPAFGNLLPALFGAFSVIVMGRSVKISAIPLLIMILLFIFIPKAAAGIGVLIPVSILIAILQARVMYKKGLIGSDSKIFS
jgi:hypothetical protein